jgi:hypothetical protein
MIRRPTLAFRLFALPFLKRRRRIATNLWPKIAIFERPDLIHIMDVAVSIESVLRDERALVTLLLHRDERTTVTLLLPTVSEAYVSNRVNAVGRENSRLENAARKGNQAVKEGSLDRASHFSPTKKLLARGFCLFELCCCLSGLRLPLPAPADLN